MIKLTELAEKYQDELNAIVENNGELWQFRIWTLTGKTKPPERDGNIIYEHIEGQLGISSSALEANLIAMGINYLTLEFLIPEEPFRTSAEQTADELATVQDGQVYFPNHVAEILTDYFQTSTTSTMTDSNNVTFNVGQRGSVAVGGLVDISTEFGRALPVTISIEISFVEGGTNALDIELYIDGQRIPYQSLVPSRAAALETNVQSGYNTQKHWASSDVFGLDITFPSTDNSAVVTLISEFLNGESLNMVHFVRLKWGDISDNTYLMTVTSMNGSAEGASFAGVSVSMGEFTDNLTAANFPACYSVIRMAVTDSSISTATLYTGLTVGVLSSSSYAAHSAGYFNNMGGVPDTGSYLYQSGTNSIVQIGLYYDDEDSVDVNFVCDLDDTTSLNVLASGEDGVVYFGGKFFTITEDTTQSVTINAADFIDVSTSAEDDTATYYIYVVALNATLVGTGYTTIQTGE